MSSVDSLLRLLFAKLRHPAVRSMTASFIGATLLAVGIVQGASALAPQEGSRATAQTGVLTDGPVPVNRILPGRFYSASVWDPVNERMLIYGGENTREVADDLWAYDPAAGTWTHLGTGPLGLSSTSAAWDAENDRMLVFGGRSPGSGYQQENELLAYDVRSGEWSILQTGTNRPAPRGKATTVVADDRDKLLMFGGMSGSKTDNKNDLWSYDLDAGRWTELMPEGPIPGTRRGHSAIWDSAGNQMLVYGGWDNVNPRYDDLWAYRPGDNQWTEISTGDEPPARFRHGVAWNSSSRTMYIYGGCCGPSGFKNGIWSYGVVAQWWTELRSEGPTPAARNRINDMTVWDPVREVLLVYGGQGECFIHNDLWAYKPATNRWIKLSPTPQDTPLTRADHGGALVGGDLYLFGGCDGTRPSQTLVKIDLGSGLVQTLDPDAPLPPARTRHELVAVPSRNALYLFGGKGGEKGLLNDLWQFDITTQSWTELDPGGPSPQIRKNFVWVWDPGRKQILLYSGENSMSEGGREEGFLNDLWAYSPSENSWNELAGSKAGPDPRAEATGVWDASAGRLIIYGGWFQYSNGSKVEYTDIWAYAPESGTWTKLGSGAKGPPHRVDTRAVWDQASGRMLLFGGRKFEAQNPQEIEDDLWSYEPTANRWIQISADSDPPVRRGHGMYWSDEHSELILASGFGGDTGTYLSDLWRYDTSAQQWSTIETEVEATANPRATDMDRPQSYKLEPAYPNPFNPTTTIEYHLPERTHVTLRVVNALGREVQHVVDRVQPPGRHTVIFRAGSLASGLYLYRLEAADFTQTRTMTLAE